MRVTIKLKPKRGDIIEVVLEDHVDICNASVIQYQGKYYIYSGMSGKFFTGILFEEINDPLIIN